MAPSDMGLPIGSVQSYNNEVMIATSKEQIGANCGVNKALPPQPTTGEKGIVVPPAGTQAASVIPTTPASTASVPAVSAEMVAQGRQHDEAKTVLIVGSIAASLVGLCLF